MKKTATRLRPPVDRDKALSEFRPWLATRREKLREAFQKSGDAAKLLAGHSEAMDELLDALYTSAGSRAASVSVVAVGGYGRRELFPYSDIDLLFLYDKDHKKEAARIAEYMLYVLWDLGLKVGQAHRSVEQAIIFAMRDMTIRTTLLDARLVAGDKKLFERFRARFAKKIAASPPLDFVEAKLSERDARHLHFGDSRYRLEPNVKEGKGGLRDLHTLWWLARYAYPIRALSDLVSMKLLSAAEYKTFDEARQFLWRVRAHLHYLAGHAEERVTFDCQHALAVAMGYKHPNANRAIERFMKRYFVAVRTVGSMTRVFCALLEDEKKRKPRQSWTALTRSPEMLGAFVLDGERLNVPSPKTFSKDPVLMLDIFRISQIHGIDIHPRALHLIGRNLKHIGHAVENDPRANGIFLDILLSDKGPEATLRRMSEAGVLGRFIPDFGRLTGQTQFDMYHVYTVDEHTLVALGILSAIERGLLKDELPLATDIAPRIQQRRVLYLALLTHDIAKGRGGNHSHLGEKIAQKLALRMGFSVDEARTVAWLVRNHLLFSNTVFKRDLADPKTVADFVAAVQTPERLKLLLVLTVADTRAVGPAVWNAWKGALMRELYRRSEQAMGAGDERIDTFDTAALTDGIAKKLSGWNKRDIAAYIGQCPQPFLAALDVSRHAAVAEMLRAAEATPLPLRIAMRHDRKNGVSEITVCTYDQHGLFSKLAGAMSLSGANITGAKIFTMKSGMAVDIFQVQDITGGAFDDTKKLARMSACIEEALSGELDLAEALAKRRRERGKPRRVETPDAGQVFIENDASASHTVIEVSGQDRTGFLYDVTRAIADLGISIATAHISTYGTQAADVFYVKDVFGMKIDHENKIKIIRETLQDVVN